MRRLALDDDVLLNIEKPARYIGHEVNSVMKDKNAWKFDLQCVSRRCILFDFSDILPDTI